MATYQDAANFTAEVAIDPSANGFLNSEWTRQLIGGFGNANIFNGAALRHRKSIKQLAQLYEEAYGVAPLIQRMGSMEDLKDKLAAAFKAESRNPYA